MDVRLARPTDAPLVVALSLDESAHLVKSFGWPATNRVHRSLMRTAVPPIALPGRVWVARDARAAALLEAQPRRYVIGWDITRLVARGDSERVLGPILEVAIDHVRSRGVPRLFARCGEDGAAELKIVGFQPLAREYVLVGPTHPLAGAEALPDDSRYRMPQDAWPLHQLESEITPPLVRQLEGLTSLDWSAKIRGMSEIVVERDGRIAAWIGWGVNLGRGYTQIGMLIHPEHRDVGPVLLDHVLDSSPPQARFVARIRDYQTDVLGVFSDAGFTTVAEEILMIRHAAIELAREARRVKVAPVPSIHAFNIENHP
jgi:hypothetical protein